VKNIRDALRRQTLSGYMRRIPSSSVELYSAIEEAKADITDLFMLQYMYDHQLLPRTDRSERQLYTTFLASTFRSLRFGLQDAHARGMAMQVNYLTRKGGFVASGPSAVLAPRRRS